MGCRASYHFDSRRERNLVCWLQGKRFTISYLKIPAQLSSFGSSQISHTLFALLTHAKHCPRHCEEYKSGFPHFALNIWISVEITTLLNPLMPVCFPLFLCLSSSPCQTGTRASGSAPSQGLASFTEGPADGQWCSCGTCPFQALTMGALLLSPPRICFQVCPYTLGRKDAFFPLSSC